MCLSFNSKVILFCAKGQLNYSETKLFGITCIINVENQDNGVRSGLKVMAENVTAQWKPFMAVVIKWQDQAEATLKQAKDALIAIGVSLPAANTQEGGAEVGY